MHSELDVESVRPVWYGVIGTARGSEHFNLDGFTLDKYSDSKTGI